MLIDEEGWHTSMIVSGEGGGIAVSFTVYFGGDEALI